MTGVASDWPIAGKIVFQTQGGVRSLGPIAGTVDAVCLRLVTGSAQSWIPVERLRTVLLDECVPASTVSQYEQVVLIAYQSNLAIVSSAPHPDDLRSRTGPRTLRPMTNVQATYSSFFGPPDVQLFVPVRRWLERRIADALPKQSLSHEQLAIYIQRAELENSGADLHKVLLLETTFTLSVAIDRRQRT
jgi:hypothetical protein